MPTCSTLPRFITTTSSATSIASSWSCVTITVVVCVSSCSRRSQSRSSARTCASSAPNGSSSKQHRRVDRERAGEPHALALAAGELRRVALREPVELDERRAAACTRACDLRLGPLPDLHAERDVVVDGHVLEGRVVLEDEADAAILRRGGPSRSSSSMKTLPQSGVSSPAITRSSVDLPLPLGPSSAVSDPAGTSTETSSSATNVAEPLA